MFMTYHVEIEEILASSLSPETLNMRCLPPQLTKTGKKTQKTHPKTSLCTAASLQNLLAHGAPRVSNLLGHFFVCFRQSMLCVLVVSLDAVTLQPWCIVTIEILSKF